MSADTSVTTPGKRRQNALNIKRVDTGISDETLAEQSNSTQTLKESQSDVSLKNLITPERPWSKLTYKKEAILCVQRASPTEQQKLKSTGILILDVKTATWNQV